MAISSGNITNEMIQQSIEEQEGEPVEAGQFQIYNPSISNRGLLSKLGSE